MTHCNTLQHTATHCNALQHTATHCNTLQHTLQHTASEYVSIIFGDDVASGCPPSEEQQFMWSVRKSNNTGMPRVAHPGVSLAFQQLDALLGVCCSVLQCGVWCGVVWCGVVWCSMVQC